MALKFPGTDIKADPMILSKLHVWKKQYGSLSQMLSTSGFCSNESANTIDVIDDQVWNNYVKFDSNARLMRYKSWLYFKDWTIIFGKYRATGESAEALADAINDISKQDKEAGDDSMGGDHIPQPAMHSNENDSENMSSLHGEGYMSNMQGEGTSTSHQSRGKKKGNKRSRNDDLDGRIVDMMADMTRTFAETKTCLGELAHRIGFEHDPSTTHVRRCWMPYRRYV
ncbi:PREDICTED: uncharacterized protein LOC105973256 [Erythranthe guttata]|uniref:uncharacterized protein LOC105973256 n=1 Tax=Erythranthe guttata TaxID=4155 RepID=UPI00064DA87B|nr:PREDICTED: uncharacterized protein LOC105973256 [Erythranthe guttata]XP_012853729.1 PREDICTED: uncharacterized protein LOC105973256 [Erythranthe guttata]XP_012853731.1 PREDICTED: uncharacterized protein LOC105973256 [Erythranthe guttata]XP_012853732.1 PREDICTED: uncharacterized protein LOC105973256 [Erythranthe guttata]|eukprot:XP_012853728.1 PREDICTED: uncharacterized protein LOC105973256 [Erythranthe guttata]